MELKKVVPISSSPGDKTAGFPRVIVLQAKAMAELVCKIEGIGPEYALRAAYGMNSRHYLVFELKN